MGNTVKTIILLIMELALGAAFGFQGYRVCQSHELLVNSIWFVQCAWMLIMHLERIVLKKKWLVPLAYLHLGLYLAGLFHILSISDYNYYEPTRLTPVFECMFFCSIFMMPTLLLYVIVWNIMNLIRRNMAGGEKKRVSPIDSEIERERGQVQQMKLEPMAFSDEPASGELQHQETFISILKSDQVQGCDKKMP